MKERRPINSAGGGIARLIAAIAGILATGLVLAAPAAAAPDPSPPGANDFTCKPSAEHPRPIVLAHGLGATQSANWGYISPRLKAAGYCVFSLTYGQDARTDAFPYSPGGVVRMQRSSKQFKAFVNRVLAETGASEVDIVGHSEGTVMPRWYLEKRGGAKFVKRFVALTPLWRGSEVGATAYLRDVLGAFGLSQPAVDAVAGFCGSCPQFLRGSSFLNRLNRDGEAIDGVIHTNIATATDELVVPYTSGLMNDGGTNIVLQDVCPTDLSEHVAVAFDPVVVQLILNALQPSAAKPVQC